MCPGHEEEEGPAVALTQGPWSKADAFVINFEPTDAKPHPDPLNK